MVDSPKVKCEKCGKPCSKVLGTFNTVLGKTCSEAWHYSEAKGYKWMRSKDGKQRIRFDPTKHGSHKGSESHLTYKKKPKTKTASEKSPTALPKRYRPSESSENKMVSE